MPVADAVSVVGASGALGVTVTDSCTVRFTEAWASPAVSVTPPAAGRAADRRQRDAKVRLVAVDDTGAIAMPALASSAALVVVRRQG